MTAIQPLEDQIRHLRNTARQAGRRLPGRPALVAATGATQHQVRKILAALAHEDLSTQTPTAGESASASTNGHRAIADTYTANEENGHPLHQAVDQQATEPASPGDRAGGLSPSGASDDQPARQHRRVKTPRWPLVLISLAAAVSVWSGWVGLGQLAGFGVVQPLPGVWDALHINTAVALPISVEAYAAFAIRCWLTTQPITPRARTFARRSAITSLIIGAAAQIAYHLMSAAGLHHAPWPVTICVATIPVLVLGLASALANLIGANGSEESSA